MFRISSFDSRFLDLFGQNFSFSNIFFSFTSIVTILNSFNMIFAIKRTSDETLQEFEKQKKISLFQSFSSQLTINTQFTINIQFKSKLRQFLDAFEILEQSENDSTDEMFQYLINKQKLTDEWDREFALIQDERNDYFRKIIKINDARFDHLKKYFKKQSAQHSAQFDQILQNQQSQSSKQQFSSSIYRSISLKMIFDTSRLIYRSFNDSNVKMIKKKRFRVADIDYFDSHHSEFYDKNDYVTVIDKVVYRNV